MQTMSMSDLKNAKKVECLCAEENGPVYVMKNGCACLVIMNIDYYERMIQKMNEAKAIIEGLEDIKEGRTVDGDAAIANIRFKYGV